MSKEVEFSEKEKEFLRVLLVVGFGLTMFLIGCITGLIIS